MDNTVSSLVILTEKIVAISSLLYIVAMILYTFYLLFKGKQIGFVATIVGWTGAILHLVSFFMRWAEAYKSRGFLQSIPITNLYESLMFFALLLAVVYLVFEIKTKNKSLGAFAFALSGGVSLFISSIGASSHIQPLVPALQSNWLLAHVSLSFVAYVCFAISAIAALLYLIKTSENRERFSYVVWTIVLGAATATILGLIIDVILKNMGKDINAVIVILPLIIVFAVIFWFNGLKLKDVFKNIGLKTDTIESVIYKFIAVGFAIFTIGGLVFGAIWAEQAWGNYWSWDPKETWAFITWIVYGIYLHGRLSGKWSKELAATIAVIGFLITIFTFLGVNMLLSGLHSYGSA